MVLGFELRTLNLQSMHLSYTCSPFCSLISLLAHFGAPACYNSMQVRVKAPGGLQDVFSLCEASSSFPKHSFWVYLVQGPYMVKKRSQGVKLASEKLFLYSRASRGSNLEETPNTDLLHRLRDWGPRTGCICTAALWSQSLLPIRGVSDHTPLCPGGHLDCVQPDSEAECQAGKAGDGAGIDTGCEGKE
jgi:hypothetical protein